MRLAFDTSVLVAALVEPHLFHARALPWIEAVLDGRASGECSTHALAETWAVLTRLPIDPAIAPPVATLAVARLAELLTVRELPHGAYRAAMSRCAERGLRSGAVFDALHLVCAEVSGADVLLTFNARDFERLALSSGPSIVVPPDPPRFSVPEA